MAHGPPDSSFLDPPVFQGNLVTSWLVKNWTCFIGLAVILLQAVAVLWLSVVPEVPQLTCDLRCRDAVSIVSDKTQ